MLDDRRILGSIPGKGRRFCLPSLWSDRLWRLSYILAVDPRNKAVVVWNKPLAPSNGEYEKINTLYFRPPICTYVIPDVVFGYISRRHLCSYHLPENLCSHLVIVLCRYDFRLIVQKLFTVCYRVTNTFHKVSLHEPVLTHWRYFTRSYIASRVRQSLECPSFFLFVLLVLGFIIWRVCVMSTCQTNLFHCQCFDQYWFELQLNRDSIYSLLLCVVSVGLYIECMPATVILKLCLTFVFVAALPYGWIGRAGILVEFIFTRVWVFDGLNTLLGLYFCFTSMSFYLQCIWSSDGTAVNYRPLYNGKP